MTRHTVSAAPAKSPPHASAADARHERPQTSYCTSTTDPAGRSPFPPGRVYRDLPIATRVRRKEEEEADGRMSGRRSSTSSSAAPARNDHGRRTHRRPASASPRRAETDHVPAATVHTRDTLQHHRTPAHSPSRISGDTVQSHPRTHPPIQSHRRRRIRSLVGQVRGGTRTLSLAIGCPAAAHHCPTLPIASPHHQAPPPTPSHHRRKRPCTADLLPEYRLRARPKRTDAELSIAATQTVSFHTSASFRIAPLTRTRTLTRRPASYRIASYRICTTAPSTHDHLPHLITSHLPSLISHQRRQRNDTGRKKRTKTNLSTRRASRAMRDAHPHRCGPPKRIAALAPPPIDSSFRTHAHLPNASPRRRRTRIVEAAEGDEDHEGDEDEDHERRGGFVHPSDLRLRIAATRQKPPRFAHPVLAPTSEHSFPACALVLRPPAAPFIVLCPPRLRVHRVRTTPSHPTRSTPIPLAHTVRTTPLHHVHIAPTDAHEKPASPTPKMEMPKTKKKRRRGLPFFHLPTR
ncbi:hypothetical protein B0H16DRAFT_1849251 [Mycena metata]|uniref:Uncharacterized protein n=1 Tax=Mycena metata TaxID=1033252 RepID=A0AAD7N6V1_9AGAR|nr:hypothetical protein B0H16DRAFT_1849251 [Mycena metata]